MYRIGQEKEVYVYYPIASADGNGTSVEEVLHNLLVEKKKLAEHVIVPSKEEDFKREVLAKIGLSN